MLSDWNSLSIDLKSTADAKEFICLLKNKFLFGYSSETQCHGDCYSCNAR